MARSMVAWVRSAISPGTIALVRTTALARVVRLSFLFLMTFADLWTRSGDTAWVI